ncbi:cyclin-I2 isoform X2 [Ochotona princeps]|uniref:cyclin-I2 isoform X2 n=1 Tax=Ochotona princeps TaxID=9978 RepID=UPI00271559D3|nr:cyclin-I2 isoform X2 [Ochotona princeps]
MAPHTRDPACFMASDERKLSPSRVSHGRTSVRSPDQEALCCLLPQRPRAASVPATWNRHPESRPSGAASLSATPSGRGPQRPAVRAPQPVAMFGPSQPLPELLQWDLWLRPSDSKIVEEPQLLVRLQLTQDREARQWRGGQPQPEVCAAFRGIVQDLLQLPNVFYFNSATFNLALTIFSRLLASGKVKEKLLHIVAVASLRLAVKVEEEEELVPQVKDFIEHYGPAYSPNELLRMELTILDKLHWDLYLATPLDFLTIFHGLIVVSWPQEQMLQLQRNPSLHVASLTKQLQHCMAGHQLLQFKGSTLALVIITLELDKLMPDCCAPTSDLLKKAQVNMEQYNSCKELVRQQLRTL